MNNSIATALIAVFSLVLGQVLQHLLDLRKRKAQLKDYPARVLYDKQVQFFDAVAPVLVESNRYLNRIQAWLSIGTMARADEEVGYNQCVADLFALVDRFQTYLPAELVTAIQELTKHCLLLQSAGEPTLEQVDKARHAAFVLQNKIRKFVGIDAVSAELIQAMGEPRIRRLR